MKQLIPFIAILLMSAAANASDTTLTPRFSTKMDSLKQSLSIAKTDTAKILLLRKIGDAYHRTKESLPYYQQALEITISIKNKTLEADCYNDIGIVQKKLGNYDLAMDNYLKALRIMEELKVAHPDDIGNKKGIAYTVIYIGNVYQLQGNYDLAMDNYLKALRISEELKVAHPDDVGNKKGIAASFNNIGAIYQLQGNYDLAMDNYLKALRIYEELKVAHPDDIGNKKGIAASFNNIAGVYFYQNKKDSALVYVIRSLEIEKEIGDKAGVATSLKNIGELYGEQGNYNNAIVYADSSLSLAREIGSKYTIMTSGNTLAGVYSKINDFKNAYKYHQLYVAYRDSLFNEEKSKEIGKLEATHGFLMQKAADEAKAKELLKTEQEKQFRSNVMENILILIAIVALVIFILGLKKRMNKAILKFTVFFTTILFFEFILALIAPVIISYTGGIPLWTMLVNAAIAALLFVPQNIIQSRLAGRQSGTDNFSNVSNSGKANDALKLLLIVGLGLLNSYSEDTTLTPRFSTGVDSLKHSLSIAKTDTAKILLLRKIGIAYHNTTESLPYYQQALEITISIKNKTLEADCYNDFGIVQYNLGNYDLAIDNFLKSLRIMEELKVAHPDDIGNKKWIANSFNNIGAIYQLQGNYDLAMDNHLKALRIMEELKVAHPDDIGNKKWIANSFNNIGAIYQLQGNYNLAMDNHLKALRIREDLKDKKGIAASFNNIGAVYFYQNKKDSALVYYIRSLEIKNEIGNKAGVAISLENIGQLYSEQGNYVKAIVYSDSSLLIAREIGDKHTIMTSGNTLAGVYSKINDFKNAYKYHQLYATYRDSIFNEEKSKEIGKLQTKHDLEMADLKKKQEEEEIQRREAEVNSRRDKLQYSVIVLGVFILIGIALLLVETQNFVSFTVPVRLIEFLTFVPFLLLFETLLVFTDPYLEQYIGNSSFYTVVANTVFAMGLFPLHRFLEKKLKLFFYRKRRRKVEARSGLRS